MLKNKLCAIEIIMDVCGQLSAPKVSYMLMRYLATRYIGKLSALCVSFALHMRFEHILYIYIPNWVCVWEFECITPSHDALFICIYLLGQY